mgnify:CR=1 FL=1
MKKRTKHIIIFIVGSLLFIGLILYNLNILQINEQKEGDSDQIEDNEESLSGIILKVDYNNGSKKIIDDIQVISENDTVFDILLAFCNVQYTEYPNGEVFINGIDGLQNKDPNYWRYWINQDYAQVGAASYHVEEGDEIEWIYGDVENTDEDGSNNNSTNENEMQIPSFSIKLLIVLISGVIISGIFSKKRSTEIIE